MTQKRNGKIAALQQEGAREFLEGLRKDIFRLLLETEGLVAFNAGKRKTRHPVKSTDAAKSRRVDARQKKRRNEFPVSPSSVI